jgi:hypothetical protein
VRCEKLAWSRYPLAQLASQAGRLGRGVDAWLRLPRTRFVQAAQRVIPGPWVLE